MNGNNLPEIAPDELIKKIRKVIKGLVLIGLASVILLIITFLQIYYNFGHVTLLRLLTVVQSGLLVIAMVYFMKARRLLRLNLRLNLKLLGDGK